MGREQSHLNTRSVPASPWAGSACTVRRRATVMVFVIAILSLLALIGLALITRTHGEFRQLTVQSVASSHQAIRDGIIREIQERLRLDIWGPLDPVPTAQPLSNQTVLGIQETNEPWDTPGPDDRWLASTMPYMSTDNPQATGNATLPTEQNVLRWHRVSYLGTDVLQVYADQSGNPITNAAGSPVGNPFRWLSNSRSPAISNPASMNNETDYGDPRTVRDPLTAFNTIDVSELEDIPILQTPVPGLEGVPLIPGSTTNLTIAQARQAWEAERPALQAELDSLAGPGLIPQFPYFDTNADGILDLYDADGDGVPDSPISFVVQTDSRDPDSPRQLYAAIRIVDHAGMVDVNTASALMLPGGNPGNPASLSFNETAAGLQRRGRRATEFLLDAVVHPDDWFLGNNRTADLADYRTHGVTATPHPVQYDFDMVRRVLLGGRPDFTRSYRTYGLDDEASLRHRNMLIPFDRRDDRMASGTDNRTIDRALRGSVLWSRNVGPSFSYTGNPRWQRLNANFLSVAADEGFNNAGGAGWRNLLDEDQIFAVRRPMLTTVNVDVMPPPDITLPQIEPVRITPAATDTTLDRHLRTLWALGMSWPVLIPSSSALLSDVNLPQEPTLIDTFTIPDDRLPAEWARVQPVDINMSTATAANVDDVINDFLRYTAAAMYLSLDALQNNQDVPLDTPQIQNSELNRQYLAWQFAANLFDYRDSDNDPTQIEWPFGSGHYIFGVEKQPFFTEAYASLEAGLPNNGSQDKWFFAFEFYVPPGWKISTDNLYFRAPNANPNLGLIPLNTFVQATSGTPATLLDGGPIDPSLITDGDHGNYYVFTSDPIDDTFQVLAGIPNLLKGRVFSRPDFTIATDGNGRLELVWSPDGSPLNPKNHVLDVIDPALSGGSLASNSITGLTRWAFRTPNMNSGHRHQFSLRRSTQGWRFTTAWHVYTDLPASVNSGINFAQSLARPNAVLDGLNGRIPESIWPARTSLTSADGEVPGGFTTGQPFEAFDSVADLSRMFLIGPIKLSQPVLTLTVPTPLPVVPDIDRNLKNRDVPVTARIASLLKGPSSGDLPANSLDRVMAGRLDFQPSNPRDAPWTWQLFNLLTTQSHLFDGVDNDGDGLTDLDDPTEAADVLFRMAGRINLNTAPATVLRSGPFMSLLPSSPELNFFDPTLPVRDPLAAFNDANIQPGSFWDFATAIVAMREDRPVPLRLPDSTGNLQTVAIADRRGFVLPSRATNQGGFSSVIELAELNKSDRKIQDSLNGRDELFQIDRLWSDPAVALDNHQISNTPVCGGDPSVGAGSPFSPDFRYSCDNNSTDYVPIQMPAQGDPTQAGGIRGRDVYLSRWTNIYTTRSDCFTAYVVLLDENGHYVQRSQVTLDRSVCFREVPAAGGPRVPILPRILVRSDGSYADDTK